MHTSVIFTAKPQTGLATKLSLAVKRLGYSFISVKLVKNSQNARDQIIFVIDSEKSISSTDFASIVSGPYGVEQVNMSQSVAAQSATETVNALFRATEAPATPISRVPDRPKKQSVRSLMSRRGYRK